MTLHFGTAYYPEHWLHRPEAAAQQAAEIELMRAAGFTVARLGEFAWSTQEPAPGRFNFAWLNEAIANLAAAGIQTVLGTPTAAPPAWLVQQHPGLLAVDEAGRRVQFGNRCHYCVNAPELHAAVRRLVAALAAEFGPHPHVIGWQIDNEFNRDCYCERCQQQFREFLAGRYGSLAALNERWATAYWSQTYSAWSQIPLPIGPHNPGLMLEHRRFVTASYRRFQKLQIDLLRPRLRPEVWLTHNFMHWHAGYDHYDLSADLDLAAWDWYIGSGHLDYQTAGAAHDLVRGYKRRGFWLMETQPGHVNWRPVNNVLRQGETRAANWHAVAHGAQAVLYWQWRSALGGQEQYHGTLLDQSGQPRPLYAEVQQIGRDFQAAGPALAGAEGRASVALLNCYAS
ncbi:MAG: beta-galactosidase, partial [Anaerolineales bacterium]|nr:beta-galactosidase [Anaerolineales bacterium]